MQGSPRAGRPGPTPRREFLRLGLAGLGCLTWPGLLRLRAEAGSEPPHTDSALLVVWLHGGASHLETYDPKPLAPSEYRGPYRPIASRVFSSARASRMRDASAPGLPGGTRYPLTPG